MEDSKHTIQMPRVKLGSHGLEVSRLGFGCAGLSGYYNDPLSHEAGCSVIKEAFRNGITFFDTSDLYGENHDNEILLSKALKELPRAKVQLATKFGIMSLEGGKHAVKGTPEYVRQACEASLKRLGTDYIDLYYQHRVDPTVPIEDTMGELKKLVDEGKIKYIGLSEASVDTMRRAHMVHPITAIQVEYSLWTRDIEEDIIPLCRELGIGIVAYSPLGRGFFGGKAVVEALPDNTSLAKVYQRESREEQTTIYDRLANLAAKKSCTPPQLALAWLLHQEDNIVPIPVTTKVKNLHNNLGALSLKLTEEDLKEISEAVPIDEVAATVRSIRDVPPAHYSLKLTSFSIFLDADIGNYTSRVFEAGGYKWKLCVHPNGNEKMNVDRHISLYLVIADTETLPPGWEVNVNFKLFVFDQIRDKYLAVQDAEGVIRRFHRMKTEWGFDQFLSVDTFNDASNGYLVDDCCVFGAEVFVIKHMGKGEYASMVKDPANNIYTWRIEKFSATDQVDIRSDEFVVGGSKWKLRIYPNGDSSVDGKWLSFYLLLAGRKTLPFDRKIFAECKLRVRDEVYGNHSEKEVSCWFCASSYSWGFLQFMALSDLNDASKGFVVNDVLTVEAQITQPDLVNGVILFQANSATAVHKGFDLVFTVHLSPIAAQPCLLVEVPASCRRRLILVRFSAGMCLPGGLYNIQVSRLGLGCAGLSGYYNDPLSHEAGCSVIREAFRNGVTFFDTSDIYGENHDNEILLSKALKELPRAKVQLATKFGIMSLEGGKHAHRVDATVPIEDTMGELKKLVDEGKIKYIGLSEASADTMRRAHIVHPISAVQVEYSLWTRDIEEDIIPICRELGIGIVAYSPLGRGFFGGKAVVEALPDNTILPHWPRFTGENLEKNKQLYDRLANLAAKKNCTPPQLALAWLLHQEDNIVPIPGTTKVKNLHNNLGALSLKLTEEDLKEISDAVPIDEVAGERDPDSFAQYSRKFANTPEKS
ncbi:hypothetical protein RHGRI_012247 [Rhododendron griersonianum]|uniref:MATH domain-containing protein n=1 Tax=Rhododendron griersonianum TaxID=479676 RepID=A0AAV6KR65_9ERIC|nr:hypothetical protein RHGRI_012247 [Rhododendron griersonianum]